MLTTVKRLFQQHTPDSVFRPKYVPILDSTNPKIGHCHVFAWLLATSSWQAVVGNMESDLQRLQRNSANKANAEAFSQMRDFRRQVADAEVLLAECRQRLTVAMEGANEWAANGDDTQRIKRAFFWKTKKKRRQPTVPVSGRARSIDIKNLRVMLRMLEGKVNDMANTVNEEIQVVIGSVQVEDAQIMKQQTEVTVVLAVLAAIYLPLTLVTGIFGMNISDISDGNKPDRVWVVKTWSWIFSVTIALIATYASVRWLVHRIQKRRKRSKDKDMDLEALKMD
jgi:Mg2+ and Co2+ transporter CorA